MNLDTLRARRADLDARRQEAQSEQLVAERHAATIQRQCDRLSGGVQALDELIAAVEQEQGRGVG